MKRIPAFVTILLFCMAACHSGNNKKGSTKTNSKDSTKYYPLGDFIRSQIQYVDLRNFSVYRISITDGKKDSSAVSKDEFIRWANLFLDKDISGSAYAGKYTESVFNDMSTGSVTLSYYATDTAAAVQNMDILLAQETNLAKRVLIKAIYYHGDTLITEQYNWKTDKSFHINRLFTTKNGYQKTELNYINWNEKP